MLEDAVARADKIRRTLAIAEREIEDIRRTATYNLSSEWAKVACGPKALGIVNASPDTDAFTACTADGDQVVLLTWENNCVRYWEARSRLTTGKYATHPEEALVNLSRLLDKKVDSFKEQAASLSTLSTAICCLNLKRPSNG